MTNENILQEMKENFEKMKAELGIKATFKDIERIFFFSDQVLKDRFVSPAISRQLCSRIAALYYNWGGYIHNLIMPNPQNLLILSESKVFSQEEKKELSKLMAKAMEMSSRNSLIGLTKDKKEEAKFIDEAVELWDSSFEKELTKLMDRINSAWAGGNK